MEIAFSSSVAWFPRLQDQSDLVKLTMRNSVMMVLSMTVVVIMSKEDDERNKAVEAAGTAVVGAGLLGGLLFGGGLLAKAIGDAAKSQNARSNGGNIVRHHVAHVPSGPASNNDYDGECDYDCTGWPYQQCKVTKTFQYGGFKSATCINPYESRSSYQMFINYPECANIPSECKRCDDVCSNRDGLDKYDYTASGPVYGTALPAPAPEAEDCSEIKGRRVCCSDYGECSGYTGPDPTPWERAKFTSCEYSGGHLQCDFTNDCSEIRNSMVCCNDDGDCSGYTGPDPKDSLCGYQNGVPWCA